MKRVFVYCRVSTVGQVDGDGLDRQEEKCRQFADKQGWEIARVFREQQSGSDEWTDRELLSEALELASLDVPLGVVPINKYNLGGVDNALGIDTILIERSDRLSRDLIVAEVFIRACKAKGVKVFAADSGQELVNSDGDPTRTLIRQVLGAVAQFDKASIVQKMQAGRRAKSRRTGLPCGGPKAQPYGDRGGAAQQANERNVITQMRAMLNEGRSYEYIADRLRRARIPTPNGDWGRRVQGVNPFFQWSRKIVERVLRRWEGRI